MKKDIQFPLVTSSNSNTIPFPHLYSLVISLPPPSSLLRRCYHGGCCADGQSGLLDDDFGSVGDSGDLSSGQLPILIQKSKGKKDREGQMGDRMKEKRSNEQRQIEKEKEKSIQEGMDEGKE